MNKKGQVYQIFLFIFGALLIAIFLGLAVFGFNEVTQVLRIDVDIGQVNLKNVTDTTLGQLNTGILNNADTIGIILLLGLSVFMIVNAYFVGRDFPKLFIVVDIFLLILFFIPSVYISQVYELFINATPLFEDTFIDTIPKVSKFILNLPWIVGTVGALIMIVSYSGIRRDKRESDLWI